MRKIDDIVPNLGFLPVLIVVIVLGIAFQLSGAWFTMLIAGVFGGLFTRRHRHSFLVGLLGVAIAWILLFALLAVTAQAMAVAEFFIGLLGLSGMGFLVIVISVLFGAFLGGFGGLFGRSLVELIDGLTSDEEPAALAPTPVEPIEETPDEE
ncbi:MAG: hypothetical protein ACW99U_18690 [Candidatus Thorarchaeota archaeon]|jgi:hypothetical protein